MDGAPHMSNYEALGRILYYSTWCCHIKCYTSVSPNNFHNLTKEHSYCANNFPFKYPIETFYLTLYNIIITDKAGSIYNSN